MRRVFIVFQILFFVVCLTSCSNSANTNSRSEAPVMKAITLSMQDILVPSEYACEIDAIQYVEIHARIQGYLEQIYVDEGQFVKKGSLLFRITDTEYREMVSKSEANLKKAIAEDKESKLELDRIKLMVEKNVISDSESEVALAKKRSD